MTVVIVLPEVRFGNIKKEILSRIRVINNYRYTIACARTVNDRVVHNCIGLHCSSIKDEISTSNLNHVYGYKRKIIVLDDYYMVLC
jgi:hypothetical protein